MGLGETPSARAPTSGDAILEVSELRTLYSLRGSFVDRLRGRSGDRHEVSDGREDLLALHRARYETPAAEPDVIRLDTTGDSGRAVEAALRELERSAEG